MDQATERVAKAQRQAASIARRISKVMNTSKKVHLEPPGVGGDTIQRRQVFFSARDRTIEELRGFLLPSHVYLVSQTQTALEALIEPPPSTSRAGKTKGLGELIGGPRGSWLDEWVPLNVEGFALSGRDNLANEAYCKANSPERVKGNFKATIDGLVERGWPQERAEVYCLLGSAANAMCTALRERSPRYASSTYALCDALWAQRDTNALAPPPHFYWHLRGKWSLSEEDPTWEKLLLPDETGFRGLTCSALVLAERAPPAFDEGGFKARIAEGNNMRYELMDSEVVCFESELDDEFGAHSAVLTTSARQCAFPPNTQFQLKEIKEPGEWEAPKDTPAFGSSMGGGPSVYPQQRLFVVTATYQEPRADSTGRIAQQLASLAPKLCCGAAAMGFGRRDAFMAGLDGLTDCPLLTMKDEFSRSTPWVDGAGKTHRLPEQWEYVNGPAHKKPAAFEGGATAMRDADNEGKLPKDFLKEANDFITHRRTVLGVGTMPAAHAFLTMEEVLAVRLFTGPAYQPINDFLRGISLANGEQRREIARHPGLTFSATVSALCAAIRKLADVSTPEELSARIYVGMRGEPPLGFWTPEAGSKAPCVVTTAFLSGSRDQKQPIARMQTGEGGNVLWELQCQASNYSGFHSGADVSLLSQFKAEQETLFPPGTMVTVVQTPKPDFEGSISRGSVGKESIRSAQSAQSKESDHSKEGKKTRSRRASRDSVGSAPDSGGGSVDGDVLDELGVVKETEGKKSFQRIEAEPTFL